VAPRKPKARLITFAWGESHVDKLLELVLPAALAPGNYPYLAEFFDVQFVLVTEARLFARVRNHPTFQRIAQYGPTRLFSLDDLLIGPGSYGFTLSKAIFRGMEDAGPQMTDIVFLFLNGDFVLAENSYRALVPRLLAGERLIASPSYCANEEDVLPILVGRHRKAGVIECSHRTMARYILSYLHDTVRGQVIGAPFHYDLVYTYQHYDWADPRTLVGRQMPIAIVAMRPTRQVPAVETFWDFGIASEFCPGIAPCVLGDSDDFLMLELRARNTGREYLRLGPPCPERVALRIGPALTDDQLQFGRYPLLLHSGEIGASVEESKARLGLFQNRMRTAIPAMLAPHLGHPMWRHHDELYRKTLITTPIITTPKATAGSSLDPDEVLAPARAEAGVQKRAALYHAAFSRAFIDALESLESSHCEERSKLINQLVTSLISKCDNDDLLTQPDAYRAGLNLNRLARRHESQMERAQKVLKQIRDHQTFTLDPGSDDPIAIAANAPMLPEVNVDRLVTWDPGEAAARSARHRGTLRRLHNWLLGQPPNLRHMHPLAPVYSDVLKRLRERAAAASNILLVSSSRVLPEAAITAAGKRFGRLGWTDCTEVNLRLNGCQPFDLVYCETEVQHVTALGQFFRNMRKIVASDGRVIVHITNQHRRVIADDDYTFIQAAFGACGPMSAHYANGRLSAFVFRRYLDGLQRIDPARPGMLFGYAGAMLYCLPLAAFINGRKPAESPGRQWASLTVETRLAPTPDFQDR
jgi:hypothetical protein